MSRRLLSLGAAVVTSALFIAAGVFVPSARGKPAELLVHFVTPGRDTECVMVDPNLTFGNVMCAIHRKRVRYSGFDSEKPSRRWLLVLNRFPVVFVSGRPFGSAPMRVLRYGHTLRVGYVRCSSRSAGLTCVSTYSGHGFFLSNTRQRIF